MNTFVLINSGKRLSLIEKKVSKAFIENKIGSASIAVAIRQQNQILHLISSKVQDDYTVPDVNNMGLGNNEYFLNWVKSVLKKDNFIEFYKYLRYPLASARLVNNQIKIDLERVFFSEDAYFKYSKAQQEIPTPEELETEKWDKILFNAIINRPNDIVITDLQDTNKAIRKILKIDDVVSIQSQHRVIQKIAYTAIMNVDGEAVEGYIYIDDKSYIFYDREFEKDPIEFPHDLGECPADYIGADGFGEDDVVTESIFTYLREELEEYVFMKTIQRMTDPNGAIPVTTRLNVDQDDEGDDKYKSGAQGLAEAMSLSTSLYPYEKKPTEGPITQAGTDIQVDQVRKNDNSIDMDVVKNFINFFYIPTECLTYLNDRIAELKTSILATATGTYEEQNQSAKNELQVERGYLGKQDKLRQMSYQMTRIRKLSDRKFLELQSGKGTVDVDLFFGSDFFIETQDQLYGLLQKAPNPIERRTLYVRLAKNRARFNTSRGERDRILYMLIPFSSDVEFAAATTANAVGKITYQFQIQFNHWISLFESKFGDILQFWNMLGGEDSQKSVIIYNLIKIIITENHEEPERVEDDPDSKTKSL